MRTRRRAGRLAAGAARHAADGFQPGPRDHVPVPFLGVAHGGFLRRIPALLRNLPGNLTVFGGRDRLFHVPLNSRTHLELRPLPRRGRSIASPSGAHGCTGGGAR
ncbi:hypothetical protein GPN2_10835 [Streptomyces murinus]